MECQMENCNGDLELQVTDDYYYYTEEGIMPDNHVQNTKGASSGTKQFFFDSETFTEFRLALRSVEACVYVSRVLVYRYECPGHDRPPTSNLRRPATPAPVCGSVVVRPSNTSVCDVSTYNTLMCTSQGVWLVCEGAENEFICKGKVPQFCCIGCCHFPLQKASQTRQTWGISIPEQLPRRLRLPPHLPLLLTRHQLWARQLRLPPHLPLLLTRHQLWEVVQQSKIVVVSCLLPSWPLWLF